MKTPWRNCLNSTCNRLVRFGDNFCSNCGRELSNEQKDTLRYDNFVRNKAFYIQIIPALVLMMVPIVLVLSGFFNGLDIGSRKVVGIIHLVMLVLGFVWLFISHFPLLSWAEKKTGRYWEAALREGRVGPYLNLLRVNISLRAISRSLFLAAFDRKSS